MLDADEEGLLEYALKESLTGQQKGTFVEGSNLLSIMLQNSAKKSAHDLVESFGTSVVARKFTW